MDIKNNTYIEFDEIICRKLDFVLNTGSNLDLKHVLNIKVIAKTL